MASLRSLRARRTSVIATLLAVLLALTACTPTPGTTTGSKLRSLTIGATLEPVTMDPSTQAGAGTPYVLLYNVYETLIKIDGEGTMKPLLATQWSASPDGKEYTFNLDPAARFASGAKVDADAVVKSIMRVAEGKPPVLKNLAEQMSVVEKAEAKDADTVVVTLKRPSNFWLYNMSQTAGIIYDPEHMDALPTTPAGSGPYAFVEHRKGESVKLERNANYWGTAPRFDEVTFRYYPDPNAMTTAMLAGQLDIISNLTVPSNLSQFSDTSRFTTLEGTTNGEIVLGFNHSKEPLKKLQVRQAIKYAIDRKALRDTVWNGHGALLGSMVPPSDPWFDEALVGAYPHDPKKAKQLLADAGYGNGLRLRLRVPTNVPYAPPAAQFIASQLAEVGITATVEPVEWSIWLEQVFGKGDYDLTIVSHVEPRDMAKFADPSYYWHYDNADFQRLIREADEGPAAEETDKMKQAASILSEDAAADFLWLLPQIAVTTPDISGFPENQTSLSIDLTTLASSKG